LHIPEMFSIVRKSVDEIWNYERGRYLSSIEAATRLASFHISQKHLGVKQLPIHLPGRQYSQWRARTVLNQTELSWFDI
jgi:hypothetical protein